MKIYRPKLCECGCGKEVKPWNRFINGHASVGKHRSEESNRRNSEAQKIAQNRTEVREKKSKSMIATNAANPEIEKRRRESQKIALTKPDVIKRMSLAAKTSNARPEVKEKQSKSGTAARIKLWKDPKYREMMCKILNHPDVKKKTAESMKAANARPEVREKRSKSAKMARIRQYKNPIYASMMFKSRHCFPNKSEIFLSKVLDGLYPDEWRYVGDGQLFIDGKCPDFVNVNGQKKIIELFGDHWHKGENPQDRIDIFKPFGYDTLVIWEHELKNFKKLRRKIFDFAEMIKSNCI